MTKIIFLKCPPFETREIDWKGNQCYSLKIAIIPSTLTETSVSKMQLEDNICLTLLSQSSNLMIDALYEATFQALNFL